jgi:hypothetical protein
MAQSKIQEQEDAYKGIYPSVFKKIDISDVTVNPFPSYKSWTIYSGSATSSALPLNGFYTDVNTLPALGSELTYNDAKNVDSSLQSVTYFSVNHLYYKNKFEPAKTYGPTNLNQTKKTLFESASILSIPQIRIGEGIKPASFSFTSSVSGSYSSDRYGNIIDAAFNTNLIVPNVKWYEGFNEYFDTNRISYISSGVTYVPGITTTTGQQRALGLAAYFSGSGYIESQLPGLYDRDHDYAISFFISGANSTSTNQLIATKASQSITPTFPFRIELSGSNQIIFTAQGSTSFKTFITSSTVVTSSWTHVVCQKSGSSLQMYVNGTLHSSASNTLLGVYNSPFTASARVDNLDTLKIGGFSPNSSNLQGYLDEIRIFNTSLSGSQISALSNRNEGGTALQTQYVGNVFGKHGIVVFSSADYRINDLLKTPFTASYRSTVTINELNVVTKLDAGDFNMSTNITLTADDDSTYRSFVSSSTFSPYITTIGLYNDAGQMLAIAKLAQPIRKRSDVDMNFLIRLDLDANILPKG